MPIEINYRPDFVSSIFPHYHKPLAEKDAKGNEVIIPDGSTVPDFIRKTYGVSIVKPVNLPFSFMSRDDKQKSYDWGKSDPFVMKNKGSKTVFDRSCRLVIDAIMKEAAILNLPTELDKDRKIKVLDEEGTFTAQLKIGLGNAKSDYEREAIAFLIANLDIAKKFSLVRTVRPGWSIVSYSGQEAQITGSRARAFQVVVRAMKAIMTSGSIFDNVHQQTLSESGDPLTTSTGYPLFAAQTKDGLPSSKLETLQMYANLGTAGMDWSKVKEVIGLKCPTPSLRTYPFAIAPLRRLQPGYKWAATFMPSSTGLKVAGSDRGYNSIRVAWMSSYILNLYMSPLQTELKAIRKLMPGILHTAPMIKGYNKYIRDKKPIVFESDYSNYDRTIPSNLIVELVAALYKGRKHEKFVTDMIRNVHYDIPLIYPDKIPGSLNAGWIFTPEKIGLLSGVKITSDEGTFANLICVIDAFLSSGVWTEAKAYEYLTQCLRGISPENMEFRFLIQSDDTMIFANNPAEAEKLKKAFLHAAEGFGFKGAVTSGDRFLMKHMTNGKYAPVPCRVFQNTLSNEDPETDPIIFLVGLATRTDGLLGQKTFDPFGTGFIQKVTKTEVNVTIVVLKQMAVMLEQASIRHQAAIDFILQMELAAQKMLAKTDQTGFTAMSPADAKVLDKMRRTALKLLSDREVALIKAKLATGVKGALDPSVIATMIYNLHRQSNVPSSALLLEQMKAADRSIEEADKMLTGVENQFYKFAMNTLKLPLKYD